MGSKFGSARGAYMMSAAVGALLLTAGLAQATTTVVATTPADVTGAINSANSGQTVALDVGSGLSSTSARRVCRSTRLDPVGF